MIYRSHNCNQLSIKDLGKKVILSGWVNKIRKFKNKFFVDLRDRYGITQLIINNKNIDVKKLSLLKNEFVIRIEGSVAERIEKNNQLLTGEIEVIVNDLMILSESKETPLIIDDQTDALEQIRFKYRYLDLRRKPIFKLIEFRHLIISAIREFFNNHDFLEIETPILSKPTPEGARDFLVPSRINPHKFYALPQSPQIYKQLFMISGIDKYYQIAKCFRDEDLRSDRQPEFTQLDVELSFVNMEQILKLVEEMICFVYSKAKNKPYKKGFKKITFQNAIDKYGSDKPDTRFKMFLNDVTKYFKNSNFNVFANAKSIQMIIVDQNVDLKLIKKAEKWAIEHNAKGLAWVNILEKEEIKSPIIKFIKEEILFIKKELNIKNNVTLFFVADNPLIAKQALGSVRVFLAKKLNLFDQNDDEFLWVVDWPLFELDKNQKITSLHHPFTSPTPETKKYLPKNPLMVKSESYDIIFNGNEIGGGSIRIFEKKLQSQIFKILDLDDIEIRNKFSFFLNALEYGTPPHGGIAFGLDRFIMLLFGELDSIKEIIAFPKNSNAICAMSNAPSEIKQEDLDELNISLQKIKKG